MLVSRFSKYLLTVVSKIYYGLNIMIHRATEIARCIKILADKPDNPSPPLQHTPRNRTDCSKLYFDQHVGTMVIQNIYNKEPNIQKKNALSH